MLRNSIRLLLLLVIMGCSMVSCKTLRRNHAAPDVTALYEPYRSNDALATPADVAQEKSDETGENADVPLVVDEVSVTSTNDGAISSRSQDIYGDIPAAPVAKTVAKAAGTVAGKRGVVTPAGSNPAVMGSVPSATLATDSVMAEPVREDSVERQDSVPVVEASQVTPVSVADSGIFPDDAEEDSKSCFWNMKILVIALVALLVLFIAYIIYTRKRLRDMKAEREEALLDLRYKHYKSGHRDEAEVQREIQEKVNAAVSAAEREKQAAVQAREQAEQELREALAQKEASENEDAAAMVALTQKGKELAARMEELQSKDEKLEARRTELLSVESSLAEREKDLASQKAELEEKRAQLEVKTAELQAKKSELHAAMEQARSEAQNSAGETGETGSANRTAEVNAMRKMLIRKIESMQTILDLKGEKKGEVLPKDEWKDIENFLESADGGFVTRLRETCPSLTTKDVELMMLLRLRIPSKNIASVYGINEKSIKQKLFVYKTKVGLESDTMSLRDYIENL